MYIFPAWPTNSRLSNGAVIYPYVLAFNLDLDKGVYVKVGQILNLNVNADVVCFTKGAFNNYVDKMRGLVPGKNRVTQNLKIPH